MSTIDAQDINHLKYVEFYLVRCPAPISSYIAVSGWTFHTIRLIFRISNHRIKLLFKN